MAQHFFRSAQSKSESMSRTQMTETALREQRKKLRWVWVLAALVCVVLAVFRIGGIVPMVAAVCCFGMVGVNFFLVVARLRGPDKPVAGILRANFKNRIPKMKQ